MKFTLVQPPLIKDLDEALNPPLGLLSIGAVLREQDVDVEIVDFNLRGFQDPAFLDPERFYDSAADLLASTGADAFGFTSMALESHVCLELARRLKERDPSALTIFGGPHFSAIATDAMERYPWLDYVVAGEAEKPLVDLLAHHRGRLPRHELANVAHRTGGRVVFDRRYQTSFPLDDLPLPAHDLVNVDEYFAVNPHRMLCLEHARGCQLRCAFCYSEAHWGHGEQIKSEGRILAELQALADLRAGHVFLVADNFLTSKDRAIRLCRLIEEAAFPFTWKCYATLAQLTPQVIEALSSAGCRSVFVGVDAASERTKRQFKKTYFKGWNTLRATLERCIENDVYPTCSFMLCSEDSAEGLEQTLQTALFAKAIGAHVCINALSRYNRTGLDQGESASSIRYSDKKPRLLFHTPAVNETNLYAQDAPQLYPMHQGSLPLSSDHDLFEFTCIAEILTDHYTSVMVRALFDADIDVSDVIHSILHALREKHGNRDSTDRTTVFDAAFSGLLELARNHRGLDDILQATLLQQHGRVSERRVSVEVDGLTRSFKLAPYRVLLLPTRPDALNTLAPLPQPPRRRCYVASVIEGMVYYTECDPVLALSGNLRLPPQRACEPWKLDTATFRSLRSCRVLLPDLESTRSVPTITT